MSEYLSKDILEEGYLRSFAPFRFVQRLLGSCRVDERDLFVTPPSIRQKLYSTLLLILTFSAFAILVNYYLARIFLYKQLYYVCLATAIFDYLIYVFSLVHLRFYNNDANVDFFIQLQNIDRKLKINKFSYLNNLLFKINSATLAISYTVDFLLFVTAVFNDYEIIMSGFGEVLSQATCTTEWLHYSNTILFFYTRIYYINIMIMRYLNLNPETYDKTFNFTLLKKDILVEWVNTHDFRDIDIVDCLKEMFEAFKTFTKLYRFQMFVFCLKTVMHTVFAIQYFILTTQNDVSARQERIFIPVKWWINVFVLIFICIRWQMFFAEMEDTKHLCTIVLATHKGIMRQKAAKMIKIIEETPPRFSVYDMWYMDATLLLKMFNIMTTIIITLIQFALL